MRLQSFDKTLAPAFLAAWPVSSRDAGEGGGEGGLVEFDPKDYTMVLSLVFVDGCVFASLQPRGNVYLGNAEVRYHVSEGSWGRYLHPCKPLCTKHTHTHTHTCSVCVCVCACVCVCVCVYTYLHRVGKRRTRYAERSYRSRRRSPCTHTHTHTHTHTRTHI